MTPELLHQDPKVREVGDGTVLVEWGNVRFGGKRANIINFAQRLLAALAAQTGRDEVLEEAAMVCDHSLFEKDRTLCSRLAHAAAADNIRALKSAPPSTPADTAQGGT